MVCFHSTRNNLVRSPRGPEGSQTGELTQAGRVWARDGPTLVIAALQVAPSLSPLALRHELAPAPVSPVQSLAISSAQSARGLRLGPAGAGPVLVLAMPGSRDQAGDLSLAAAGPAIRATPSISAAAPPNFLM